MVKAKQIKLKKKKGTTGTHYEDYEHIDYSKISPEQQNFLAFNNALGTYNNKLQKMKLNPKNVAYIETKDSCDNLFDNKVYNIEQYKSCMCGVKTGFYGKKVAKESPECEIKQKKVK